MPIEPTTPIAQKHSDFMNLPILWVIASCIGVYLIITTILIANDGINFIQYAQHLEMAPLEIIQNNYQHPGYPGLILAGHLIKGIFYAENSISGWIYCAQGITLLFRLLTITVLYFIGKHLIGARLGFWAILIYILLPDPAEYGSDALSDWPHLFFLSLGLLLLIKGARKAQWPLFGLAGLAAGAGYLVRPECAQVIILGCLWSGLQFVHPKRIISRTQACCGLALLLIGFASFASPYMMIKGDLFPKKHLALFSQSVKPIETPEASGQSSSTQPKPPSQAFVALNTAWNLLENTGETLMWFFIPAMGLGLYQWFDKRKWREPEVFFIAVMIILNILIMFWLFAQYGYMSNRHTLPLLMLPILFVPVGLQRMALCLNEKFPRKICVGKESDKHSEFWFLILVFTGAVICTPKLLSPIRTDKQDIRAAALWLNTHTEPGAIIAVPDERISFYAQRKGIVYENGIIPDNAQYFVTVSEKREKDEQPAATPAGKLEYEISIAKKKKNVIVSVYKKL